MTRIVVAPGLGRSALELRSGALAVRVLEQDADGARVALVANGALLLAGDSVDVEVEVAEGAWLEVVETTGTVAYGGAEPSRWDVDVRLGVGARLTWGALPFVVSDGARTHRRTEARLAEGARALLRETLVLGRTGQAGGDLWSSLTAYDAVGPLQVEELDLSRPVRGLPGVLATGSGAAPRTVVDTVLALGWRPAPLPGPPGAGATLFELDRPGAVLRWLGTELHRDTVGDACLAAWSAELAAAPRTAHGGATVAPMLDPLRTTHTEEYA
ncbi:urease accessory protein UreD [Cellulomonas timonensis]|uniref:urease accessory protein UreD n=1 Tax=Cellulomonas timonensis TaxID=1689271 RepID=UPI00082F4F49|nr:urease accessory protein UreD [Cellulomonas timonensis]